MTVTTTRRLAPVTARNMPTNSRYLCLALLLSSGCNQSEYEIIPSFPTYGDDICLADTESWYLPSIGQDMRAGQAMTILSTGSGPGPSMNTYRWQVTGAPGSDADEDPGYVHVAWADVGSGLLQPSAGNDRTLVPPTGPWWQLGRDVLAVDMRDCRAGATAGNFDGCGQELLASAPDTFVHDSPGRVFWWESDGDPVNSLLQYGGEIMPPVSASNSAAFGYALAAAHFPSDPDSPWDAAGYTPDWVAISAPGDDHVHIYAVDSAATVPLSHVQTLAAPIPGRKFGHDMVVGDFDGDGYFDLAVSGPLENGTDPHGYVWVYAGQAGSTPLDSTAPLQLDDTGFSPSSGDVTHYGWSLAAGGLVSVADGDTLVVGAPRVDHAASVGDEDGGFCQVTFLRSGGVMKVDTESCWRNAIASAGTTPTNEQLGMAVAVGNFHNSDSVGGGGSIEARMPELAVGRPGAFGNQGAVDIFVTDELGVDTSALWAPIREYAGPASGARFGTAMGHGFIQNKHWEDLAIGAPEHAGALTTRGSGSLTKATDNASCLAINGYWEADDVDGVTRSLKVWSEDGAPGDTHVLFREKFRMALYEDFGTSSESLCQWEDENGDLEDATFRLRKGTELVMSGAWPAGCTTSSHTWTSVPATDLIRAMGVSDSDVTASMDVKLTIVGATGLKLEITDVQIYYKSVKVDWATAMSIAKVNSEDCWPAPDKIDMTIQSWGVCE